MLTEQERGAVINAIAEFLSSIDEVRQALRALVDDQQFSLRLRDPPIRSPLQWARIIVEHCEEDGWTHVPPWLFNLLSRMPPIRPELAPVAERIRLAPPRWMGPAAGDPLDAIWLAKVGLPFVDRRLLRENIRRMRLPAAAGTGAGDRHPAVLVVTGPEQSGKSYTVELLNHYARERRAAPRPSPVGVGVVTIQRDMGASTKPEVLAERFADVLLAPRAELPADIATPNRMNEYLSQWVLERVAATGKEWWLVLDGLNDPDLPEETIGFITKLAEQVVQRADEQRVLLVLIGCPRALAAGLPGDRVAREELGEIGEVDLEPFFEQLLIGSGSPSPPPAAVKMAVFLALKDLPRNGDRLPRLNETLRETVARVGDA